MTVSISTTVTDSLGATAIATAVVDIQAASGALIPADRNFHWNPGMMSVGGIPARSTIFATLAPSGADDSALIQAKLDACPVGQVVVLVAGTFIVNSLLLLHSSITLRGAGASKTILKKANGAHGRTATLIPGTSIAAPADPGSYSYDTSPVLIVGPGRWCSCDVTGGTAALTANAAPGATSIIVDKPALFTVGAFVLLDELSGASYVATPTGFPGAAKVLQGDRAAWNIHSPSSPGDDPDVARGWFSRYDRPTNEIKEIKSIVGNTVTFTSPLSIAYRVSHSAQLTRYSATGSQSTGNSVHVRNAGVETMSIVGGADAGLRFECAAYSWAKGVEVTQWIGEGCAINNCFRVELRDSKLHTGSWPEPGGAGYAVSVGGGSSELLIENNIMRDTCKCMVFRSAGAGSVVGYNYADDSFDYDTPTWVEVGINASHMCGPHHVLFEGNYSHNFDSDYTHGNAIYLTVFRNQLSGRRKSFTDGGPVRCVGAAYGSWWDSFIGNVLGRPGQMAGFNYEVGAMAGNSADWNAPAVWMLGYDPIRWQMFADPKLLSTVIRDGNYDYLTNTQKWHTTPAGFAIPPSMYLTSKPAFFGSATWPWVDPVAGTLAVLPAKARYEAGASA